MKEIVIFIKDTRFNAIMGKINQVTNPRDWFLHKYVKILLFNSFTNICWLPTKCRLLGSITFNSKSQDLTI